MAVTVARKIGDAGGDRPPWVEMADGLATDLERPDLAGRRAEQQAGHLLAAGAEDPGDAEDLAGVEIEVERGDRGPGDAAGSHHRVADLSMDGVGVGGDGRQSSTVGT